MFWVLPKAGKRQFDEVESKPKVSILYRGELKRILFVFGGIEAHTLNLAL